MADSDLSTKNPLFESLSALVDGEASELEVHRLLKAEDGDLEKRWQRYQLASLAIKGKLSGAPDVAVSPDLYAKISAAIADESTPSVDRKKTRSGFWSNVARFGIVASVAGAVVIAVQLQPIYDTDTSVASTPAAPQSQTFPGSESLLTPYTRVAPVRLDNDAINAPKEKKQPIILNEATQQQLQQMKSEVNRLMLEHAQNASQSTQQGVLPYVRVPESE